MTPLGAQTPHAHPALPGVITGLVLLILAGAYLVWADLGGHWPYGGGVGTEPVPYLTPSGTPSPSPTSSPLSVQYRNATYHLQVNLPADWKGFSVLTLQWQATDVASGNVAATGPKIVLRHPLWTAAKPYEDFPIMVFTTAQWAKVGSANAVWSLGAAPIPPSALASTSAYVFALPARYNYDFALGFQELDDAIRAGAVSAY